MDGGYIVYRPGAGGVPGDPHIYASILDVLAAVAFDSGERGVGEDLKTFVDRYITEGSFDDT